MLTFASVTIASAPFWGFWTFFWLGLGAVAFILWLVAAAVSGDDVFAGAGAFSFVFIFGIGILASSYGSNVADVAALRAEVQKLDYTVSDIRTKGFTGADSDGKFVDILFIQDESIENKPGHTTYKLIDTAG